MGIEPNQYDSKTSREFDRGLELAETLDDARAVSTSLLAANVKPEVLAAFTRMLIKAKNNLP